MWCQQKKNWASALHIYLLYKLLILDMLNLNSTYHIKHCAQKLILNEDSLNSTMCYCIFSIQVAYLTISKTLKQ